MKSILISVKPKYCELIASGEKTVEVRKTKPKLETPFKVYIYETKGKTETPTFIDEDGHEIYQGRGQVIGEFVCDEIYEHKAYKWQNGFFEHLNYKYNSNLCAESCLSQDELMRYGNKNTLFGWHISNLVIYDKPRELGEFFTIKCTNKKGSCSKCDIKPDCIKPITRPPQSWMYCESEVDTE